MKPLKVIHIVGARPQFIKAAVVSRVLSQTGGLEEVVVHTGQHYDEGMSGVFFHELAIPAPAYNLSVGPGGHGAQTGRMLEKIEAVLLDERPDWVLVYGDTNSTLAGALAASKLHIRVAHVEAGLRSFNKRMPEEQNRIVSDHLADLLLTPTQAANNNLEGEGIAPDKVRLVGDVMYDAALFARREGENKTAVLDWLNVPGGRFVLSTVHRAENTDDPARLTAILGGLALVADEIPVVLPLHPRTRSVLANRPDLRGLAEKLTLIEPVGYFDMAALEAKAQLVATDSGGVQKEAYFHGKPCVTLRDETEWVELVDLGWNRLQPPESARHVAQAILGALGTAGERGVLPYGDGDAGGRIVAALKE